jgi:anti-repressor protein
MNTLVKVQNKQNELFLPETEFNDGALKTNPIAELLKVTVNEQGQQLVSARDLHKFLEIQSDFTHWCKRMFEYGFSENEDFTSILTESTGGRPSIDYALKIDMAKEISMIQRTDKGKQARLYFIECEKRNQQPQLTVDKILNDPDFAIALLTNFKEERNLRQIAETKLIAAEHINEVILHSDSTYNITDIAKELGIRSAFELNKRLCIAGIQYRNGNHFVLTAKYSELDYVDVKDILKNNILIRTMRWTIAGRLFLIDSFNKGLF